MAGTFLLSTEYFYVEPNCPERFQRSTVNVQNYALGVSAVGFCPLYPLLFEIFRDRLRSAVFRTVLVICFCRSPCSRPVVLDCRGNASVSGSPASSSNAGYYHFLVNF